MSTDSIQENSLEEFFVQGLITDIVGRIKSGKEAAIYCCRADESTGFNLLAAKVYHPLKCRGFRNDAVYQEGYVILDARYRRAFKKKTRKGREVQFGLWVEREFETLSLLYDAGADVPKPVSQSGSAILMEYVGDGKSPASPLKDVFLGKDEALPLFNRVMRNIELFLAQNRVHADLPPFNILYHEGNFKIIDFPQAVDPRFNPHAQTFLMRDVENVCRYFTQYGIEVRASEIAVDLWTRFLRAEL